jgi:hypothetical protein
MERDPQHHLHHFIAEEVQKGKDIEEALAGVMVLEVEVEQEVLDKTQEKIMQQIKVVMGEEALLG